MTLVELLNRANEAYPDNYLNTYYDPLTGELDAEAWGDTLAEFIVIELKDTFDPDATNEVQLRTAREALQRAIHELDAVVQHLEEE